MPNFADDEGRYWWNPRGTPWHEAVEIPHAPVMMRKDCSCAYCCHERGVPMVRFIVSYPAGLGANKERLRNLLNKAGDSMAMVEEMS